MMGMLTMMLLTPSSDADARFFFVAAAAAAAAAAACDDHDNEHGCQLSIFQAVPPVRRDSGPGSQLAARQGAGTRLAEVTLVKLLPRRHALPAIRKTIMLIPLGREPATISVAVPVTTTRTGLATVLVCQQSTTCVNSVGSDDKLVFVDCRTPHTSINIKVRQVRSNRVHPVYVQSGWPQVSEGRCVLLVPRCQCS